jgi:4-aminobutyrate aminotransferase-like enzyme
MVHDRAPARRRPRRKPLAWSTAYASATGHEGHILKIRPPLVFSSDDAKLFLATLDEVLTAL